VCSSAKIAKIESTFEADLFIRSFSSTQGGAAAGFEEVFEPEKF